MIRLPRSPGTPSLILLLLESCGQGRVLESGPLIGVVSDLRALTSRALNGPVGENTLGDEQTATHVRNGLRAIHLRTGILFPPTQQYGGVISFPALDILLIRESRYRS